jgi:hypothetical protein
VTPVELCRTLLVGPVAAAEVPELADDAIRDDVRRRLGDVGCELAYAPSSDRWIARLSGSLPHLHDHEPVLRLGEAELALLAACWLHLRFLPLERARLVADSGIIDLGDASEPWIDPEDLVEQLGGRIERERVHQLLDQLRRTGFVALREGRLYAGPLLDAMHDATATEQARMLLTRHQRRAHLQRRAAELRLNGGLGAED